MRRLQNYTQIASLLAVLGITHLVTSTTVQAASLLVGSQIILGDSPANHLIKISFFDGNAKYEAPGASGTIGSGTVLDYSFYGNTRGTASSTLAWVERGAGSADYLSVAQPASSDNLANPGNAIRVHNYWTLVQTTGNDGSTGAWATNLGTGGNPSGLINTAANSILRSPDIDLTGVTGAKLTFAAAYDAKNGDVIEVLVREVGTGDPLGDPIVPIDTTSATFSDWTTLGPFDLPAAADNKNIYIEFRYAGSDGTFIGLYIDDVTLTQ